MGNCQHMHSYERSVSAYTSDDTQTTGIGNGSGEFWASCNVHTSQQDWVIDLQEIGEGGLDLLRGSHLVDVVNRCFWR